MQNTSETYQRILADFHHRKEVKVVINGVEYGQDKIVSLNTKKEALGNDTPTLGKAVAGEIELSLFAESSSIPRMAEIKPYVRITSEQTNWASIDGYLIFNNGVTITDNILTFPEDSGASIVDSVLTLTGGKETLVSEWIQKGVYYIDTREIEPNGLLRIRGYDAMLKCETPYPNSMLPWPTDDIDVVVDVSLYIDVDVDQRTRALMNQAFQIPFPAQYTMRETLAYIAALYGGTFIINDVGALQLICLWDRAEETFLLTDELGYRLVFGTTRILVE